MFAISLAIVKQGRSIMRIICSVFVGLSALVLLAPKGHAADRYAMSCIENKTDITLNYKVKWGDNSSWEEFSIGPGRRTSHTWEYDRGKEGKSPWLYVKFDDDLTSRMKNRDYRLASYRSPQRTDCSRYGKEYQ